MVGRVLLGKDPVIRFCWRTVLQAFKLEALGAMVGRSILTVRAVKAAIMI